MRTILAALLWMSVTTLAYGQLPSATINGRVSDPQGARVSGAQVTVTNTAQGTSRQALTNAEGLYVFSSLDVGSYNLRVESSTFAATETHGIVLEAGKARTIDLEIFPAGTRATVNVTTDNQGVELSQSMIQGQITSKTIENIPLNGRNFSNWPTLSPAIVPPPPSTPPRPIRWK